MGIGAADKGLFLSCGSAPQLWSRFLSKSDSNIPGVEIPPGLPVNIMETESEGET